MTENVTTEPGQPIPEDADIKNRGRYGKYWDKRANVRVRRRAYGWFILLSIVLAAVAFVDMLVLDQEYPQIKWGILGAFGLLVLIAILMMVTRSNEFARVQSHEGELQQAILQCPECKSIFEYKETHFTDHQKVSFSCPVCGTYGSLPGIDSSPVKKRLPEGDLREYVYRCTSCREDIRVGAFGAQEMYRSEFRACPHCGEKGTIEVVEKAPPPPEEPDDEDAEQQSGGARRR